MINASQLSSEKKIHCVGIKGTGLSALAELLHNNGSFITGSDTDEQFPTQIILDKCGITYYEDFNSNRITTDLDFIIYSAAYTINENPELAAAQRLNIPLLTYPEALGLLSQQSFSIGITGVNGKTSTTAICASVADALELPFSVICGSGINQFDGSPCLYKGKDVFIAETCEYRKHFLNFSPNIIILTNVELDHTDYFPDISVMEDAFLEYIEKLPENGTVIYCIDDPGAERVINKAVLKKKDLRYIPYGFSADGDYKISDAAVKNEKQQFTLGFSLNPFFLNVPGDHNVLNCAAAIAACKIAAEDLNLNVPKIDKALHKGIEDFKGTKRRAEVYGEAFGILFIDDYGHHPSSIITTLKGLRKFYPKRRIIIDFMSHTYTRTESLFEDFTNSFDDADIVILNKIYSSAREKEGKINGKTLYEATSKKHPAVYYFPELDEAFEKTKKLLIPGDLFITMGAGDNWKLTEQLYEFFLESE